MIRLGFIAALILAVMSCNQAPKTTVKVHVDGEKGDYNPQIITKDSTYEVALDSTGTAVFVLAENLKPGYAQIRYGRVILPAYVEPAKSFEISLNFEGRKITPKFTGEGARKNEYLNSEAFQKYFPDFKLDEDAFIASLDGKVAAFNTALDSMGFDNTFNQLEKKRIHYLVYGALNNYPSYHAYYAQLKDFAPTENFYVKLQAMIPEEEALIDMREYQSALQSMVQTMVYKDMESYDGLTAIKKQIEYVNNNITSPVVAENLLHHYAMNYVGRSGVDHLDVILPAYQAKVSDPAKKAKFDELCAQWAKIAKGQPSPDFKYLDINGKEVSLKDLAGKYVFIDVWATWCGPCRGEIPHLKNLEHQFEKKNINFVSISCDQDKAAWEKMVKDEKLGGVQLHAGGDQSFMNTFMIRGIPRFILLDREGKIIAADMTRPSNPKTVETLNALAGI